MIAIQRLTWSIWQRNRKLALAAAILTLLFGVVNATYGLMREASPLVSIPLMFGIGVAYLMLIAAVMFHDADVGSKGSSFPSYLFTLPVRTYQLVLAPMILGSLASFTVGIIATWTTRLGGMDAMLYLPPMTLVAILAFLQASFWYPVGIPYSKLFLTLIGITGIMIYIGVNVGEKSMLSEPGICQGLLLFTLACYMVAYIGVNKARKGESTFNVKLRKDSSQEAELPEPAARPIKWLAPFKNSGVAQRWYEWRQHGMVMPTIMIVLIALFYIPMVWNNTHSPVSLVSQLEGGLVPYVPTYIFSYFPLILGLIPFIAWMVGSGARRSDVKHNDRTLMLFFGVRPMSDGGLVREKLLASLKSSLATWGIALAGLIPVLFMKGGIYPSYNVMTASNGYASAPLAVNPQVFDLPLWQAFRPFVTLNGVITTLLILVVMVAITWRNYVVGYWTELSGKVWLRNGYPIFLLFGTITIAGVINTVPNEYRYWNSLSSLNAFIWTLVGIKLSLALWLMVRSRNRGILSHQVLLRSIICYLAGLTVMIGITLFLTKEIRSAFVEYQPGTSMSTAALIVGFVFLWTPIVRVLLAPIMLHNNRHRAS